MTFLKVYFVCSILYFSLVMAIKVSILLMYRRVFAVDSPFRLQSFLVGVFVLAFWFAASITRICFCRPIGYIWMGLDLKKHCLPYKRFWMAEGIIDILVDIVILALPVRMVLKTSLSPKQKASVMFLFLLGGLSVLPSSSLEHLSFDLLFSDFCSVIVTGLLRVIYVYLLSRLGPSYSQGEFWSTVHITTGIVCACLPTLRPLFSRTPLFASTSSSPSLGRWRYYHMRGWHSTRGSRSTFDTRIKSKLFNAFEMPSLNGSWFGRHTGVTNPQAEKVWFRDSRLA